MKIENIHIVGSGNVANFWANMLLTNNLPLKSIVARNQIMGQALASLYGIELKTDYSHFNPNDLVILCISDSQIEVVSNAIENGIICHCSGAVGINTLSKHSHYAVIYPLQSIQKLWQDNIIPFPFLMEYNSRETKSAIEDALLKIIDNPQEINSEQRLQYHLSAVMVNNFTNAMIIMSQDFCKLNNLDFELLKPLMAQTFDNLNRYEAKQTQTGPAKRNDLNTINAHLLALADFPELKEVYQTMSDYIKSQYLNQ